MQFWIVIGLILMLSALGLTYEIAAGRVLAPFFGTSLLTWTTVIAVVLAGFSLGSALGGLVAERERHVAVATVRKALIVTAVLMALSPTVLGVIYASGARETWGMFLAVVVAFFPASVLVSFPSPFLAKMAVEARPGREGSSLGIVLAAGSLGAIVGAILAGFVTLPLLGSVATFVACGVLALLCVPLIGAGSSRGDAGNDKTASAQPPKMPITSLAVAGLLVLASMANGAVCRYESGLSCIDVVRQGNVVYLFSDRTLQAAEQTRPPHDADAASRPLVMPYTQWLWTRMDHDLGAAPSVLFIGGGGYSLPTKLLEERPAAQAVAVEIDPLITQVVRAHLPWAAATLDRAGHEITALAVAADAGDAGDAVARLGIVHADGRVFLNETGQRFDAAVMDAFSSDTVPAHLATRETYARLAAIVDGPVYVNLIDVPQGRLVRGVHAILQEVYPHVEAVQGPVDAQGRANVILSGAMVPLAPISGMPAGFVRITVLPGRAFTDDRGWVGHR